MFHQTTRHSQHQRRADIAALQQQTLHNRKNGLSLINAGEQSDFLCQAVQGSQSVAAHQACFQPSLQPLDIHGWLFLGSTLNDAPRQPPIDPIQPQSLGSGVFCFSSKTLASRERIAGFQMDCPPQRMPQCSALHQK